MDSEGTAAPLGPCWRDPPSDTPRAPRALTGPPYRYARNTRMKRAVIFLLISCWLCLSAAVSISRPVSDSILLDLDDELLPYPTETDLPSTLLIDTRIPVFVDGHWQIMSSEEHRELRRRGPAPKDATQATKTTEVVIDTSTVTESANPPMTTTAAASPLPSVFDGALAANFSTDKMCPDFINEFLSNDTFKACYPVSLLFQGSQSFFEAEKSLFSITQVLDAACHPNVDMCTDYFNKLATQLIADGTCAKEYKLQNALVVKAYLGMRTYETVYKATCLQNKDSDSGGYCFANAITNATTPSNSYLYYLPFNSTLPSSAAPACGSCTRQTMQIYQAATANRKAEISYTYAKAAQQINAVCGDEFVNTTLAAVVDSGAPASLLSPTSSSSLLLLFSFVSMVISHWI